MEKRRMGTQRNTKKWRDTEQGKPRWGTRGRGVQREGGRGDRVTGLLLQTPPSPFCPWASIMRGMFV